VDFFAAFFAAVFSAVFSEEDFGLTLEAVGTPIFFSGFMNFGLGGFFSKSGRSIGGRWSAASRVPVLA
jgi:hypothetical protein